jgi:putative NADH-flavin reductase
MPVIVVGADTPAGEAILDRIHDPQREIRVFVSDADKAAELRARGFKVALGDVSDESHVEAAATRCFSAVLIAEAAVDGRELSFARTQSEVLSGWANAVRNSEVTRVIWIAGEDYPETKTKEVVAVDPGHDRLAETVVELDDAHSVP